MDDDKGEQRGQVQRCERGCGGPDCEAITLGFGESRRGSEAIEVASGSELWRNQMVIADRLRALREAKHLSQGDIEKRTGLLRCYISRVENGHTVPAIETLEKMARAMEVPLYQLFYDGERLPVTPNLPSVKNAESDDWGSTGKDARTLGRFRTLLGRIQESERSLLLHMAQRMERPSRHRTKA